MKKIFDIAAHIAIAMLLGFIVITVLHGYNPLMAFLTSNVTRVYIIIMCACGVTAAVGCIAAHRK